MNLEIHKNIIEAAKSGERNALKELYDVYSKAIYNTCMRMLNNQSQAQDCLQESFINAFEKLSTFDYSVSFGAWLKKIAVNRCINELKRDKRTKVFLHSYNDENEEQINFDEIQLKVKSVMRAMKMLPEGSRIIFSMYLLEGYDHYEISNWLGISESTSKSQLLRAKRKVKELVLSEKIKKGSYENR